MWYLVTGANGGIGEAICRKILEKKGNLIVVCRTKEKAECLKQKLQVSFSQSDVSIIAESAELSNESSIQELASRLQHIPLHCLINNAAECPKQRELVETSPNQYVERQFATNVLGYYWMTWCFLKSLYETAKTTSEQSRIVYVASYWAGDFDLLDLEFQKRIYDNDTAYRQTKQADRMLVKAFHEYIEKTYEGLISINACNPADVPTKLAHDCGYGGHQTPEEGARTPFYCAYNKATEKTSGYYFEHLKQKKDHLAQDANQIEQLWSKCKEYTKVIPVD